MKVLKILGIELGEMMKFFYRSNQELKQLSYTEHFDYLKNLVPVHLNHFAEEMRDLGFDCSEVVYDLELLQKSWANENGVTYGWHSWKIDILMEQINFYRPGIIYLQNLEPVPFWFLKRIKKIFPFVKKVVAFKGNLPNRIHELRGVDYVFAGHPDILNDCLNNGIPTELFYHCFDEKILPILANWEVNRKIEKNTFTFVGYSGFAGYGHSHNERYRLLKKLLENSDLKIWSNEQSTIPNSFLPSDAKPLSDEFPESCSSGVFGLPLYSILKNSNVVFNKHAEICNGNVGNMRLFESTGVGTCLLTDSGSNIKDLFTTDKEVVTYNSEDELFEKLDYLLNNDSVRKEIGEAGQKRTLKDHSLRIRCKQISETLLKLI